MYHGIWGNATISFGWYSKNSWLINFACGREILHINYNHMYFLNYYHKVLAKSIVQTLFDILKSSIIMPLYLFPY